MFRMPDARSLGRGVLMLALLPLALGGAGCAQRAPSEPSLLAPGPHALTIGGSTLAYNVYGTGPILFAHPGGPGMDWGYDRMPEVETFATVVYIEPVGTGRSSLEAGPRGFTLDRYAADVESLRVRLGQGPITLLGHSHGGFVAQTYALRYPGSLSGLILYDTTPTTGPEWQKDVEAGIARFKEEPWFADAAAALAEETTATTDSAMTAIFHREFPLYVADWTRRQNELEGYRNAFRCHVAPTRATDPTSKREVGVAPALEVRDRLSRITAPTLLIVGRMDFVTPEKYSRIIQKEIRDSRLVVLEQSGHMGHVEEPEAFADAVRGFIQSLPRGPERAAR